MKTYFIKALPNHDSRTVFEALKHAVLEAEGIQEFDPVFSLSYDRADQFYLKTPDAIVWGRIFNSPAGYREVSALSREMQKLLSTFQLPLLPYVFFQELSSGHGLLKALPGETKCFEFSFLRSENGAALALKDLHHHSPKVMPPAPEPVQTSPAFRLSRSEISELMELSLELKRLKS